MKNLLLKLANRIINKYGIHELRLGSEIKIYEDRFHVVSYSLNKSLCECGKLEIECWNIDDINNIIKS